MLNRTLHCREDFIEVLSNAFFQLYNVSCLHNKVYTTSNDCTCDWIW